MGDQDKVAHWIRQGGLYTTHYVQTQELVHCRPAGLVFRITAEQGPVRDVEWREFTEDEIRGVRAPLEKILVTEYYHRRALYHKSRGENAEGVRWVRKMDTVAQGYDQTLMLTGFAFANFGMVPESLKYFEAALKINPKNRASRFYIQKYSGKG
jgi:hypothetical protein